MAPSTYPAKVYRSMAGKPWYSMTLGGEFVFWARAARRDIRRNGIAYASGYLDGWRTHHDRSVLRGKAHRAPAGGIGGRP